MGIYYTPREWSPSPTSPTVCSSSLPPSPLVTRGGGCLLGMGYACNWYGLLPAISKEVHGVVTGKSTVLTPLMVTSHARSWFINGV